MARVLERMYRMLLECLLWFSVLEILWIALGFGCALLQLIGHPTPTVAISFVLGELNSDCQPTRYGESSLEEWSPLTGTYSSQEVRLVEGIENC